MSKHVRPIATAVLTVLALSRPAVAQEAEEFKKFKDLMASAEQQYSHVEFRSKWVHYARSGNISQLDQVDGFMAGPYCVTEQTTEHLPHRDLQRRDASPISSIQGSNARYRFLLRRKAGACVLTEVTSPFSGYQPWQCSFAVPMTSDTYHSLLARADTRVVSQAEVAWRGRPHTEWVLDATTGVSRTSDRFQARIGLFVRPDRPGLVCGIRWYDSENPTQWLTEFAVEYEAAGGPWPPPKVIEEWEADKTEWLKDKSAAYNTRRTVRTEFRLWRRLPPGPPGEQFTLSHYNLPEPKHVPTTTALVPGLPRGVSPTTATATAPEYSPDPEEPTPFANLAGAAADSVWLWLIIGLILVVAASAYVRHRRRADVTAA